MSEAQRRAVDLARFYFRRIAEQAGLIWNGDNDIEIELIVSFIIDGARADMRDRLDGVLERINALEQLAGPRPEDPEVGR
jgi:hypothetical protein